MKDGEICAGCYDSHCRHADWCEEIRIDTRVTPRRLMEAAPALYEALRQVHVIASVTADNPYMDPEANAEQFRRIVALTGKLL